MATTAQPLDLIKTKIEEVDTAEAQRELSGDGAWCWSTPASRTSTRRATSRAASSSRPPSSRAGSRSLVPDRSQRVVLYCRTGARSARAADQLQELGYENVASSPAGSTPGRTGACPVVAAAGMTKEQRERYSRHTLLPEVGVEGQLKLLDAKVLLLGAGGLGSPTALYLAAAGIGTLGLVDDDVVDESNLQRQVIHTTERVGMPKTESARKTIEALNPDVKVVEHRVRLDPDNVIELLSRLRRHRRRRRQLPDPLPAQRRLGAAAQAGRLGLDPRLRRARSRPSSPSRAPAIAASTRSRRPPSSRRAAAPPACSA